MKNNKLIGIVIALLVCLSVVVSVSAATESDVILSLGSSDPKATNEAIGAIVVNPEGTVSVTVSLDANAGIYCLTPSVEYDAAALEYVSSEAADGITARVVKKSDGVLQLIIGDILAGTQLTGTPVTYTGEVVTLTFKALAAEADKVTAIDLVLEDIDVGVPASVNASAQTASVKVNITAAAHTCTETITLNDKAATCTETGATGDVYCTQCGKLITASEEIPALGHKFDLEAEGEITKKPDCLNEGMKVYYCLNEGCDIDAETEGAQPQTEQVVLPIEHEAVVEVAEKAATCFEAGNTAGTMCQKCGQTLTGEVIPSLGGHDLTTSVTDATCVVDGIEITSCSRCEYSSEKALTAPGHKYTIEVTYAGCETEGFTTYTCSVCDDQYTADTVSAQGHKYGDYKVVTPATRTEEGLEDATCAVCGAVTSRTIEALGGVNPVIIVVIAVVVLAGIAVAVYFILKSKKAKN